jgi:hypothetical protein
MRSRPKLSPEGKPAGGAGVPFNSSRPDGRATAAPGGNPEIPEIPTIPPLTIRSIVEGVL